MDSSYFQSILDSVWFPSRQKSIANTKKMEAEQQDGIKDRKIDTRLDMGEQKVEEREESKHRHSEVIHSPTEKTHSLSSSSLAGNSSSIQHIASALDPERVERVSSLVRRSIQLAELPILCIPSTITVDKATSINSAILETIPNGQRANPQANASNSVPQQKEVAIPSDDPTLDNPIASPIDARPEMLPDNYVSTMNPTEGLISYICLLQSGFSLFYFGSSR